MNLNRIRWIITVICFLLFAAHLVWPRLSLDVTSTILLIVALLPWLAPVIKSIELPGGFKIEVQDLKAATEKVIESAEEPIKARAADIEMIVPDPEKRHRSRRCGNLHKKIRISHSSVFASR